MNRRWGAIVGAAAGLSLACSGASREQRGAGPTAGREAPVDRAQEGAQAGASGSQAAAQPKQPEAKELPEVTGRLTQVTKDELGVRSSKGDEVKLKVDPTLTSIDLDGRQARLADLTPGTEVRASYEEAKGTKQAIAVHGKTGDAPAAK